MGFFSWLFKRKSKPRELKLGLALGSGGAKGFAELGALKAFEENGIQTIKMIQPDKYNGVKIESIPYSAASEDIENFLSVDTSETVNLELKNVNSIDYIGTNAKNRIASIIDTTETVGGDIV